MLFESLIPPSLLVRLSFVCLLCCMLAEPQLVSSDEPPATSRFLYNGVTAHRGDSSAEPENTMRAMKRGIEVGADWLELDIFRAADGQIVVTHDRTTARVGDRAVDVTAEPYVRLSQIDVAYDFRKRMGLSLEDCPPQKMPLLTEVLAMVVKQDRTRVSIQPKMDCVAEAIAIIREMKAEAWCGFNDGNLEFMSRVKQLAPELTVFWDRRPDTDLSEDIRIATERGFEALVVHHTGLTAERIAMIQAAGLEAGAWTVNDPAVMERMLDMGIDRIYTDRPADLLAIQTKREEANTIHCEGVYAKHLQGIAADNNHVYWSFTTKLVKTDTRGKRLHSIDVADHHGDLCLFDGKLYVAVNLGPFNHPDGTADSWLYVYEAETLEELSRHPLPQIIYGAGGVGIRDDRLLIVGGLPPGKKENFLYEYDLAGQHLATHTLASGYTRMGIQTAAYAFNKWWFGCYGEPRVLLIADRNWTHIRRVEFDCSLGIAELADVSLLVASGRCDSAGCTGQATRLRPRKLDR